MSVAATLERFAATMRRAAEHEIVVARVRLFGTRAWVAYRPDHHQQQLRRTHPIGPVPALELLDTLLGLPIERPVPVAAVAPAAQRRLRRLPEGMVTWSSTSVTRRFAPPVMPLLAMVQGPDWAKSLRAASRFAMYCERLMVVPELPADEQVALAEASFYGIGVALRQGESLTVVLEPEKFTDWQPTAAWWWFTEEVSRGAEQPDA